MRIAAGFELAFECERPTPMVLMLSPHPSRSPDLLSDVGLSFTPRVIARNFTDAFGNHATRIVAPVGTTTISTRFAMHDSGRPDEVAPQAQQHPIEEVPDQALVFLQGSRYCETDRLMDVA